MAVLVHGLPVRLRHEFPYQPLQPSVNVTPAVLSQFYKVTNVVPKATSGNEPAVAFVGQLFICYLPSQWS